MHWRERYPGYDVMSQRGHWDDATRAIVLDRVHNVPPLQFFDAHEAQLLQAICDRVLPQEDRVADGRIPIVPWIDQRCHARLANGVQYEGMPPDWEAWRIGLRGIDETSLTVARQSFTNLDDLARDRILALIAGGDPPGETWTTLPARRFFTAILVADVVAVYYAHPIAWNEIGFGGPAYPRGYLALNFGRKEQWEVDEAD